MLPPTLMPKNSLRKAFSANLRRERQKAGLSQDALAGIAGLDRTYVGSVERGERNISIDNIERLAWGLDVKPADLMRIPLKTRETIFKGNIHDKAG